MPSQRAKAIRHFAWSFDAQRGLGAPVRRSSPAWSDHPSTSRPGCWYQAHNIVVTIGLLDKGPQPSFVNDFSESAIALSRRKQGFESPRERQKNQTLSSSCKVHVQQMFNIGQSRLIGMVC